MVTISHLHLKCGSEAMLDKQKLILRLIMNRAFTFYNPKKITVTLSEILPENNK